MILLQLFLVLVAVCALPATAQQPEMPEFVQELVPLPMDCRRNVGCPRRPDSAGVGLLACLPYYGRNECDRFCGWNVASHIRMLRQCPPFTEPAAPVVDKLKAECRVQCEAAKVALAKRNTPEKKKRVIALVYASYMGGDDYRGGFKTFWPRRTVRNQCRLEECDKPHGCFFCPQPADLFIQACWYCEWTGTICDEGCVGSPDRWKFELFE